MLGEQTVKTQDRLEVELKKFLEEVISKTEKIPTDKINFERTEKGTNYDVFGERASHRISDTDRIKHGDRSLYYSINIYYPEDVDTAEWTERHQKEFFFTVSFSEDTKRYTILVKNADNKNFANYDVTVYMKRDSGTTNCLSSNPNYKIAYYFLASLTEREEYKFVDKLMERAKSLVLSHKTTRDTIDTILNRKQEFLSIISDVVNTGN